MVEMKDSDNRGQGSRSDKAVTKTVRLGDLHWKLERLDAVHRQLLTGLAAVGELYSAAGCLDHILRVTAAPAAARRPTASLRPSWWPS